MKEPSTINERHVLQRTLIEAISTSYMWRTNQHTLLSQVQLVQSCIVFFDNNIDIKLDVTWTKYVCSDQQIRGIDLNTHYVDLRRPHFVHWLISNDKIIEFFDFDFMNEKYYVTGLVSFEITGYPFAVRLSVERGLVTT